MSDERLVNAYGEVVFQSHDPRKMQAEGLTSGATPTQIANDYLKQNFSNMGLAPARMEDDEAAMADVARADDPIIRFSKEKDVAGSKVVVYDQMVMGLPIFGARIGVHIDPSSMAVTSAQSSMHGHVKVANPDQKADNQAGQKLTAAALKKMLRLDLNNLGEGKVDRQVVLRFEPSERTEAIEDPRQGCFGGPPPAALDLPTLPDSIQAGSHYVVNEVLFRASRHSDEPPVNWRALVEPKSSSVLYIRALVAGATGMVFARDPQTQIGAAVTGASSNAVLNPFRSSEVFPGIAPANPQPLEGNYVRLAETSNPVIASPTEPNPPALFNYDVRTDDFSAANTYFHCDKLFRTMEDYGFNIATYFNNTAFPVPCDHRALGNAVNAQAPGNAAGNGLGELRFALLQAGQPVGIATDNRVVWHEFGHALLWDNVDSPNFGFAHSAGDSLACILNDPGSNAVDRFDTFPWVQAGTPLGRRHDRTIAAGWAWFGPQYNTQYNGEQILATTMFRLYRSMGGDANHLPTQTRASQTVAYLIFKAIGLLTSTTPEPQVFVSRLQEADLTTTNFKGIPGGALHKVVRWAFEKQGLFQPAAQPGQGNTVITEGNPPAVDVYIDDGRNGQYQYLANHWSCQDMWVRNSADGALTHQNPLVGLTNYMYVRVKNRGLQQANAVRVDAYHCLPGTGLSFPDDWMPMDTPTLPAAGPIASGSQTIVGPFAFVPTQVGHECLLAICHATDDPGNDTTITGTIPEHRLVPFDNNIGQRNVNPVLPSLRDLIKLLRKHLIWIRNPFKKPVVCLIEIEMPRFLRRLGWSMPVISEGRAKFELGPRERREVILAIDPGQEFSVDEAKRAIAQRDNEIHVRTYLDGELSGGMTYPLSFDAGGEGGKQQPPTTKPPVRTLPIRIEEILKILGGGTKLDDTPASGPRVKTVRLEFDLVDDDGPDQQ